MIDWQPHRAIRDTRCARVKNYSCINGPYVAVDAKFEVMTPEGDILRFRTEEGLVRFLKEEGVLQ